MIDAILKLFGPGFVVGLALGGYALLWWDHRPADMPAVHWRARAPLSFIHFDWTAPQSLAADDAAALAAEAAWAKNFTTLHSAFAQENAAVASLGASAARWREQSRTASDAAARANRWRLNLAAQLSATRPPADGSELGLCRAADAVLLRAGQ